MRSQKILILGAGGFIGSHLTAELMNLQHYQLTAVDINNDKLKDLGNRINYINVNLKTEKRKVSSLIEHNDIIINLVAIANPSLYLTDPLGTFELDFMDNLFVVEECVKHKKRLIQFSTSEVYGKSASVYNPEEEYVFHEDESNLILGPINKHRWIYASSKQLLERVIHAHGIKNDLNYAIVRPFNYIGPKIDFLPSEEDGVPRVFSLFMDALLYNKTMYLVNGGDQQRCYTDIRDATDAHIKIIDNVNNVANQEIINVGHRRNEISIKGLGLMMREIWIDKYGSTVPSMTTISGEDFYGKGYDDSDRRIPHSVKIESMAWSPKYAIEDTLLHSMEYYVNRNLP